MAPAYFAEMARAVARPSQAALPGEGRFSIWVAAAKTAQTPKRRAASSLR